MDRRTILAKDFRRALEQVPDDAQLSFSGLTFYRIKRRGPDVFQVEFNEAVYRDGTDDIVAFDLASAAQRPR
jgi:hypothetical protein